MTKDMLPELLMSCLQELGGEATIVKFCECFWDPYEEELKRSGALMYTWGNMTTVGRPLSCEIQIL